MTDENLSLLRPTSIVVDAPPVLPSEDEEQPTLAHDETAHDQTASERRHVPTLPKPKLPKLTQIQVKMPGGGRSRNSSTLVGLDIQPGYASAVEARVNGTVMVQRAAGTPLPPDTMREGEVIDENALSETLHEMFATSHLDKRVRVGIANQRTVLRTLELPPLTDRKELATAVRFQAEDQVPMPLDNAVLDFHPLGIVDTPNGPRQRVIVVAAQRDMVERLLGAVRSAGLRPEGVDLSAFALIRSLHHADEEHVGRVLYLNVGGLTNMAIAEETVCRFTRVVSGGLESMATDIAERNRIPLREARDLLASVDLDEQASYNPFDAPGSEPVEYQPAVDVRPVLIAGVREIAGEVRNSLDFHRSQDGGGDVSSVILSGSALQIQGFAKALQAELHVPVIPQTVGVLDADSADVSPEQLAVAAGLATEEAPR
jgi:type IV pilus assembly protein PilM